MRRAMQRNLTTILTSDRDAFIDELAQKAPEADAAVAGVALYKAVYLFWGAALRRPPKSWMKPLAPLRLENGEVADTPIAVAQRWQRHCAEAAMGVTVDQGTLPSSCSAHQNAAVLPAQPAALDELISPVEVNESINAARQGGAPGEDGITAKVYKLQPARFAALYGPLALKVSLWTQEPLQSKGGPACKFHKGNGEPGTVQIRP